MPPLDVTNFIRKASRTHGLGVHTTVAIEHGQAVFEFGGPVIRFDQITPEMRVMQVGHDAYVAEDIEADYIENYVNHCCEPNLGFVDGSLTLRALRDIAAGEELFWDYSTSMNEPGWSMNCACGSPLCRGVVRSFHALADEQQRRLRPIALAYLRDIGK